MSIRRLRLVLPLLASPALAQEPVFENRLAGESSPYLLQHKNNPVDWYPWGPEALERAVREDKVIFLSIGYSACHWCHVMEHESFENPQIAALLNEKFVNIKVDREERPDLDEIYMAAVVGMTGHGGWPMSVFMTPQLEPFFGGTYYPPEDARGLPGFRRVIEHVDRVWRTRRDDVNQAAAQMVEYLREQLQPPLAAGEPKLAHVDAAAAQSRGHFDAEHGGFGRPPLYAPKFPHASELSMLLRHYARTGDATSLQMVETTLQQMARGGIFDQLGGGFHRYSTDRAWLVPHFEKMLYDNALLSRTLAEAYAVTGNELYAQVLRATLDYLLREMQDPAGGFYSSQDADSEGVEGKFFVWSKDELEALLGEDAELAGAHWGVTEHGNWEHTNVLHQALPLAAAAAAAKVPPEQAASRIERARQLLLRQRGTRVRPGTDDKVLAAWNGLAIAALAVAHQVLDEPRYLDAARRAADFVLDEMVRDGRLLRTWRRGAAKLPGYLEDYAFLADGLLCLFESDFDPRWLAAASQLLTAVQQHFHDPADGAFFFTADDHERLVVRNKSLTESSIPSGQAMAVLAFLRAGLALGDPKWEEIAAGALRAAQPLLEAQPLACPTLLLGVELHLADAQEVVIAGELGDPATAALLRPVRRAFPPHRSVAVVHAANRDALAELSPLFAGKELVHGKPAAYVCRRGVCEAPTTDPGALPRALGR